MADPNGIQWDDEAPASDVVWDDEVAGPPRADFGNVQGGVEVPRGTLPKLSDWSGQPDDSERAATEQRINAEFDANQLEPLRTGMQAIGQDYQYPEDGRRRVSVPEGLLRRAGAGLAGFADLVNRTTPQGMAEAAIATARGEPTMLGREAEALALNPETETYASARGEAIGNIGGDIIANLAPVERLAKVPAFLANFGRKAESAAHDAALVGELGPAAQGKATGDEIVNQAIGDAPNGGDLNITPEMRAPAEPPREAVPAAVAEMDRPRVSAPEAVQLPASEPLPGPAEGGMAAPVEAPAQAAQGSGRPPETLFHASLSPDIESFDMTKSGSQSDTGIMGRAAGYFTGDERLAPMYLGPKKAEGTLYQVEHSLQNPKEFDSPQAAVEWQGERGTDSPEAAERVRQKYLDAGHDGVIVRNPQTGKVMEAAVFDPAALKVTGKRPLGARATPREPLPVDEALGDSTNVGRAQMQNLPKEVGWEERGGRIIRGQGGERGFGDVTGRTPWVAKSDFWPKYRAQDANPLNEREAAEAFRKLGAGEKLGKREQRFMDYSREYSSEMEGDYALERSQHTELARQEHEQAQRAAIREAEEKANAENVRVDPGQPDIAGQVASRREVGGGRNIQQAGEAERLAEPEYLRREREARNAQPPQVEPGQTGIYNAHVAEERARRGLEEVKHDLSRTDPEGWARAEERIKADPNHGRALAAELARKPRPATKEEVFTLIQDRQRIKNERRAAYERAELAHDTGDAEKAIAERNRIARLDEEMDLNDTAARVTGHESAEGLRARQRMSRDDYSMAEMVQRTKVRKGERLTDKEVAALEARAKDVEVREAALAKREQELRERPAKASTRNPIKMKDAGKRFNALVEEMKKTARATLCEIA